jgi:hypothetical protein
MYGQVLIFGLAAFVIDLDGNNIEAVCFAEE